MKFRFTAHALEQIERRRLDRHVVERVLELPQQVVAQRSGREARQSRVDFPDGEYLVRAIVDRGSDPPAVITAYRTRYVAKYLRKE